MEEMIKQIENCNCMKKVDIYLDNLKIKNYSRRRTKKY
jgi:hypothetical protein